jgi:hypothetical protein
MGRKVWVISPYPSSLWCSPPQAPYSCLTEVEIYFLENVKLLLFIFKIVCLGSKKSIPNIPEALVGRVQNKNMWLSETLAIRNEICCSPVTGRISPVTP